VHGGAFAFGDLDMPESDWVARSLAERGISVVAVDYQLAPEPEVTGFPPPNRAGVHFPVASEEVSAAFEWTVEHAEELGITATHLSLGGASAGGNLAAGAALRARDIADVQPHSLLLAYPLVHAVLPPPHAELAAKIESLAPEHRFPPEIVGVLNLNYVLDPAHLTHPYAFAGTQDLAGLPPTFVLNSDYDSLRSSGELFASELASAGVDVLVMREPGTKHGHLNDPELPEAERSIERMSAWLTHPSLVGAPHPARSVWSS
jgi:acetyl esterase